MMIILTIRIDFDFLLFYHKNRANVKIHIGFIGLSVLFFVFMKTEDKR